MAYLEKMRLTDKMTLRKYRNLSGIYCIRNKLTGENYIGSSQNW